MTAAEVMTSPCLFVPSGETLRGAAQLMNEKRCHSLMVAIDGKSPGLGIITCKDIVQVLADEEADVLDELLVGDYMTTPLVTVQKDMALDQCIGLMRMTGTRRVPVMDGSKLLGLLSFTDLLKLVSQ